MQEWITRLDWKATTTAVGRGVRMGNAETGRRRENSADSGASSRGLDLHTAIFIETTRWPRSGANRSRTFAYANPSGEIRGDSWRWLPDWSRDLPWKPFTSLTRIAWEISLLLSYLYLLFDKCSFHGYLCRPLSVVHTLSTVFLLRPGRSLLRQFCIRSNASVLKTDEKLDVCGTNIISSILTALECQFSTGVHNWRKTDVKLNLYGKFNGYCICESMKPNDW